MRDAQADLARRAWVRCSLCPAISCAACRNDRSCQVHWTYLLAAEGRQLFLQCPRCWQRWWHDSGFGAGDRPHHLDLPPIWPAAA